MTSTCSLPVAPSSALRFALAVAPLVIGCRGPEAVTEAAWALDEAVVLYERRDSAGTVLLARDMASTTTDSVTAPGRSWAGRLSPGGERIVFISLRDGNYELYVSDRDGGSPRRITEDPDYDVVGAWSPDGRQVAFMSTRGFELGGEDGPFPGHVYVVDVDDPRRLRQVTREPLTSSLGPSDWSPDGRWLAIAREVDGQVDVFLLDVTTGEEQRVTSDPSSEYGAVFSHDGRRIAYHADDGTDSRLVVSGVDGSGRRVVTPGPGVHYSPRWSPDDGWLLATRRGGLEPEEYDVVAVRLADGHVELLVVTPADERAADWM